MRDGGGRRALHRRLAAIGYRLKIDDGISGGGFPEI